MVNSSDWPKKLSQRKSFPSGCSISQFPVYKLPTWLRLGCVCTAALSQLRASVPQQGSSRNAIICFTVSNFCVNIFQPICKQTTILTINPCEIDHYASKVSLQFHISRGSVIEPRSLRCNQSISVPHFTFAFTSFPSFIFYLTVQLQSRKLEHALWDCAAQLLLGLPSAQGSLLSTPASPVLPICIGQQAQKWLEYAWGSSISFFKISFLLPSFSLFVPDWLHLQPY